jgi:hypothetical protein
MRLELRLRPHAQAILSVRFAGMRPWRPSHVETARSDQVEVLGRPSSPVGDAVKEEPTRLEHGSMDAEALHLIGRRRRHLRGDDGRSETRLPPSKRSALVSSPTPLVITGVSNIIVSFRWVAVPPTGAPSSGHCDQAPLATRCGSRCSKYRNQSPCPAEPCSSGGSSEACAGFLLWSGAERPGPHAPRSSIAMRLTGWWAAAPW